MEDTISRKKAIDALFELYEYQRDIDPTEAADLVRQGIYLAEKKIEQLPSAQPETHDKRTKTHSCDCISRQAAIDAHYEYCNKHPDAGFPVWSLKILEDLPSAQPERRCVNCGRTVNNGGWYEDGRTRCPIEEHYALPKDGYCHLWEKRKDWEDDYVKRAEEGEK